MAHFPIIDIFHRDGTVVCTQLTVFINQNHVLAYDKSQLSSFTFIYEVCRQVNILNLIFV